MNGHSLVLSGHRLAALPSGALWWEEEGLLCVSDLHLGKSERFARRGGALLPPYETEATLDRLEAEIDAHAPRTVICLGDSFDDRDAAASLAEASLLRLARLQAGRHWVWIEGNHDPGPTALSGTHVAELVVGGVTFRHIAGDAPDISGHYHPKARLGSASRPAFLADRNRIILPAFGAYTGGLSSNSRAFDGLFGADAIAVLTGPRSVPVPLSRLARSASAKNPALTRFGR